MPDAKPLKRGQQERALSAWAPAKGAEVAAKPKVRYLEGVPVHTGGAKYVVQKVAEEWDGGSRGRVKTKGKRGPGWTA